MSGTSFDFASMTVADFATRLAAKVPAPGGGAVAGVTAAHAAALLEMVLAYSVGKKRFAAREAEAPELAARLAGLRAAALAAATADAEAYARLNALWKLPDGDAIRTRDFPAALDAAIAAPNALLSIAGETLDLAASLLPDSAPALDSDLAIAADLAAAAARAAAWNVRVNLPSLADATRKERAAAELAATLAAIDAKAKAIGAAVAARG
jgi:formiminotetrahydrofolate cyclodeaminase